MDKSSIMNVKLKLIKKELPICKDTPAGLHRYKYYVQYVTIDDYLLSEREAVQFDFDLFARFGRPL